MLLFLLSLVFLAPVSAWKARRTIDLVNNCPHDIWIGAQGNPLPPEDTGFLIPQGGHRPLNVPATWISGRIWARTGCSWQTNPSWGPGQRFVCATGDCGAGSNNFGIQCKGIGGQTPSSLAEFTLSDPSRNNDFYDLSNVDGWNVDISIESLGGTRLTSFGDPAKFNCGNPSCHFDINRCPTELTYVKNGKKYCLNLCLAVHKDEARQASPFLQSIFNNDELLSKVCCDCWYGSLPAGCQNTKCAANGADCCGCFNPSSKHCCSPYDATLPKPHGGVCRVEDWPKVQTGFYKGRQFNEVFKDQCPDAYSWQFDDFASTYQCKDSDYKVTFCSAGGSAPQSPPPPQPKPVPKAPQTAPKAAPNAGVDCGGRCAINGDQSKICQPPGCPVCKIVENGKLNCRTYVGATGKCPAGHTDCNGRGAKLADEEETNGSSERTQIIGLSAGLGGACVIVIILVFGIVRLRRTRNETV